MVYRTVRPGHRARWCVAAFVSTCWLTVGAGAALATAAAGSAPASALGAPVVAGPLSLPPPGRRLAPGISAGRAGCAGAALAAGADRSVASRRTVGVSGRSDADRPGHREVADVADPRLVPRAPRGRPPPRAVF